VITATRVPRYTGRSRSIHDQASGGMIHSAEGTQHVLKKIVLTFFSIAAFLECPAPGFAADEVHFTVTGPPPSPSTGAA